MANGFVPVDREQLSLLPTDMGEWLEEGHLAWFVIDVVGRLDLSGLAARYRLGGAGRRAYDPAMLLSLLIYAYSQGERSSRRIERGCRTDAAYRVICGRGPFPDHSTLCRFRERHQDDIGDLFAQVVRLARRLGMARLGVLAVDGTKVAAAASLGANRSDDWIRARIDEILAEAAATDEAEDAVFGDEAGDQMPAGLADPEVRAARLQAALDALGEEGSGSEDPAEDEPDTGRGRKKPRRVNLTDPDSRVLSTADGGFVQGYNCQIAVAEDGLVVAAKATNQANDYGLLSVMLNAVHQPDGPAPDETCRVMLADAGYFDTEDIARIEKDPQAPLLLVATGKRAGGPDPGPDPALAYAQSVEELDRADRELRRHRTEILQQWETGDISYRQAARLMEVHITRAYHIRDRWRHGGVDNIPVPKRRRPPPPTKSTVMRHRLETRLADPDNRLAYQQRGHLAETPFAQLKHGRRLRRFSRRGINAVNAEFLLDCLIHNLLRLRTATQPA